MFISKNVSLFFKLVLFFALYSSSLIAEEVNDCSIHLNLSEFQALALQQSPRVLEIDSFLANELAQAIEIEQLKNPNLDLEYSETSQELNGDNDAQISISIGQPLRLSDFGARDTVARLLREKGESTKRYQLLELMQQFSLLYNSLYSLESKRRIYEKARKYSARKVSLMKEGVDKGRFSMGAKKLFEGEMFRLEAQENGLSASIALLQSEIGKILGTNCELSSKGFTSDSQKLAPLASLVKKAQASSVSAQARIQLLAKLSQEESRLARRNAYPTVEPRFIYQHTNDGGDFYGLGITMPLPFWNKNQAEKNRTVAAQKVAKAKSDFFIKGGLRSQLKLHYTVAQSLARQSKLFKEKVVPSYQEALREQESLYSQGRQDILDVWQTFRTYTEVQEQELELLLKSKAARAQLSLFVGEEV